MNLPDGFTDFGSLKRIRRWLIFLVAALLFAGHPIPVHAGGTAPEGYVQKSDNYLLVFDASQSMWYKFMGRKKSDLAKQFVTNMNQAIPGDLRLTGAVRTFGHANDFSVRQTVLYWGPAAHDGAAVGAAVAGIGPEGGTTPLAVALSSAGDGELPRMSGHSAVIVVSDGEATGEDAVAAATALKSAYGDRICIYPVLIGDSAEGQTLMERIAQAGGCGFTAKAANLEDASAMREWVTKVFYRPAPPKPPAPAEAVELDSDGDGVVDSRDRCPGTPKGARVDEHGCWVLGSVLFDFDKAVIRPEAYPLLDEVLTVFNLNPGLHVTLEGHTCNIGSEAYNQGLSERRAKAVAKYLTDKGVSPEGVRAVGYGETQPAFSNETKESRAKNRRVQITPQ